MVEVGCGEGNLSRLLQAAGARPWRLDRRPPVSGSVADVVADANRLPLTAESVDFLVAGNLLRHLWPLAEGGVVPGDWQRCLAPRGCLYILEDEPADRPPAVRNYRDLQAFLAQLVPESRRTLLARGTFARAIQACGAAGSGWILGLETNRWPADPQAALAMLRGESAPGQRSRVADRASHRHQQAVGEVARLIGAIERHGLAYGQYWWARWCPEV